MANVRMVTRTVKTTIIVGMTVDVTEGKVYSVEYTLSGTFSDEAEALKAFQKAYDTETLKIVAIQSICENETLYGMTEAYFIEHAVILPPRKVYETETEE